MKIKIIVNVGRARSSRVFDFPDKDLLGRTTGGCDRVIREFAREKIFEMIDWEWKFTGHGTGSEATQEGE